MWGYDAERASLSMQSKNMLDKCKNIIVGEVLKSMRCRSKQSKDAVPDHARQGRPKQSNAQQAILKGMRGKT